MLVRLVSIAVALAVLLPLLIWGGRPGAYLILATVISWAQWEYAALAFRELRWRYFPPLLLGGAGVAATIQTESLPGVAAAVALAMIGSSWWVLFSKRTMAHGMHSEWARLFLGTIYVPLPLAFFPLLLLMKDGHGLAWLILTLAATWGGDGGGYCAGRAFGRTKLSPLISPNKTWEGVAGGVAGGLLLCGGLKLTAFPSLRWIDCLAFPVFINLAGVTGDLVESMMKRDAGVKDSGIFLPGHGGMLDRIDSIVFALPLAYAYAKIFSPLNFSVNT
jgi:phosphatidate cytidylyltransferase